MNTYEKIDIYTTVSFVCNDPEREAYWLSLFFKDLKLLLPGDLEGGVNKISKDLVFDHHPMPTEYLKQIGMTFEELEASEEVIYHQYLWTIVGNFETNLDPESFKKYLKKNTKLEFEFAEHVELVNGEQIRTANALQIVGGTNCYALDITALEKFSTAELKSNKQRSSTKTPFDNKVEILATLWNVHRDNKELQDFIEYNDIGLPLAYFVAEGLVTINDEARIYINETFDLLLEATGNEDIGFESLDEIVGI